MNCGSYQQYQSMHINAHFVLSTLDFGGSSSGNIQVSQKRLHAQRGRYFCKARRLELKGRSLFAQEAQAVREDPSSCFPRLQLAHEYLGVAALSRKREDGVPVICFMDAWHSNLLAVPRLYNSMELADLNS